MSEERFEPMEWAPLVATVGFFIFLIVMVICSTWGNAEKTKASVRMMEIKQEGK